MSGLVFKERGQIGENWFRELQGLPGCEGKCHGIRCKE